MAHLPLANILHHKLSSVLSAVGIGIGICMLVTLTGLSRGSLFEIADRWESVDADLIVFPRGWGDSATARSGVGLSEKLAPVIRREHPDLVDRAVPVFTWPVRLAGQDHMATGIVAEDWPVITGDKPLKAGRLFDPQNRFADWLETQLLHPAEESEAPEVYRPLTDRPEYAGGLELVIDDRLASAGGYRVGQTVSTANHDWTIVGIVPAGVMSRVFLPLRTAQDLFNAGDITKCTLIFLKLREGVDAPAAAAAIGRTVGQDVVPVESYRGMLEAQFGQMFTYVDAVNIIALVIAFLFVMVTLYTMVLQRTREIAILKSCGATNKFIVRQVLCESLMLTGLGTGVGIALSYLAGWAITRAKPLLTVEITPGWLAIAVGAALGGAAAAALYPAWRATRVDMVEALNYE
jgi:putative ABC transport system permease protein